MGFFDIPQSFQHLASERIIADPLWLVIQFVIILVICLALGKVHEGLHYYKAKKLGYKVTSFGKIKNFVDIHTMECDGKCNDRGEECFNSSDPNFRKVALFPYVVLVPIGWLLLPLGWFFDSFGIFIAGIATVLIHGLYLRKEGKQ